MVKIILADEDGQGASFEAPDMYAIFIDTEKIKWLLQEFGI
ncbi:MAG TPA: hypothetical protein PKA28_18655 [Methylomusa anaerophila]|nr:hypothetical protein [Methylomusa anaerophila]HML90459.1 hypothetical protein [Methylomusa anaerophila]